MPIANAWWDLTWDARVQLTFDTSSQVVPEDLDNFPVLIVLNPGNVNYGLMEPNGADLRFVDADDTTLLDHEIESWNPGGTSYVWVRVPRIDGNSSTDFIYLYYDKTGAPDIQNPSGVWSAGYLAVWHMDDDPSGAASVLDSTGNAKHGTGSPSMDATNLVGGRIGQATNFDGSADFVRVPSNATDVLAVTGNFITVEAWVTRSGVPSHGGATVVAGRQVGTSWFDSYALFGDSVDRTRYGLATSNSYVFAAGAVPALDPTWYYLATTHDASFTRVYADGGQINQSAIGGPITTDNNDVTIGAQENGATSAENEWHQGRIDEVRISNVARSADWIAAQHLSMTDNFVTFEHCPGGIVTTTADTLTGGSLRACVIWANNNPGADTITVPAGTYNLTLGNVGEDLAAEGDLDILGDLTITGAGARTTIIDGASNDRIFDVYDGHVFTISDMTLRNGDALTDGADGGAIDNHSATITITDVTMSGNSAKNGGALGSSGGSSAYVLQRVTMSGNTAEKSGAMINNSGGDTTTMTNVTITGNTGTLEIGAADIDDADLVNVTIVGNTAPATKIGGIRESGGGFTATNTIIANNTGGDCNAAATTSTNSIDSDGSCGLNTSTDPKLNALADNGGPTDTMHPQTGSPAIDGGFLVLCATVDQRSISRPQGTDCDVGAVEALLNQVSGTVFEDVNYGGGLGRDLTTSATDAPSFTVGRGGVTVELYTAGGNFLTSTATVAGGSYSFNVIPGNYTVRVVNGSVTSSRPGSDGSELAVQTYRIDGVAEAAGDGAKKVGGELPSNEDAAANSGAQTLASLQGTDLDADGITEWTQSIVTVDASAGDVSGVDFGFNFDVVVNTNNAGQGSLRQFIVNSNLLN